MKQDQVIELQNLTDNFEDIELAPSNANLSVTVHDDLAQLLQWIEWDMLNQRPASRSENVASVIGLVSGAAAACWTFEMGRLVGDIIGNAVGAPPELTAILGTIMGAGTFMPRAALGAVAGQETASAFVRHSEEPVHQPRKNNQSGLRIFANGTTHILCAVTGLMGAYVHFFYFKANVVVRWIILPAAAISVDLINQTVCSKTIAKKFASKSPGATDTIIQLRAELKQNLSAAIEAIYAMDRNTFDDFFAAMTLGANSSADKMQYFFNQKPSNPAPQIPETWLHTLASGLGVSFAAISTYIGVSAVSNKMAEWFCTSYGIEDKKTQDSIAYTLIVCTYAPYCILSSTSAKAVLKNQVSSFYGKISAATPTKIAHHGLRKFLERISPVFGTISVSPNVFFALDGNNPWYIKSLAIANSAQATVFTGAIKKMFHKAVNYYESLTGNTEAVTQQTFVEKLENLSNVIAESPDNVVIALHQLTTNQISPAVAQLSAPQYARINAARNNSKWSCGGFFKSYYQTMSETDPDANLDPDLEAGTKTKKCLF